MKQSIAIKLFGIFFIIALPKIYAQTSLTLQLEINKKTIIPYEVVFTKTKFINETNKDQFLNGGYGTGSTGAYGLINSEPKGQEYEIYSTLDEYSDIDINPRYRLQYYYKPHEECVIVDAIFFRKPGIYTLYSEMIDVKDDKTKEKIQSNKIQILVREVKNEESIISELRNTKSIENYLIPRIPEFLAKSVCDMFYKSNSEFKLAKYDLFFLPQNAKFIIDKCLRGEMKTDLLPTLLLGYNIYIASDTNNSEDVDYYMNHYFQHYNSGFEEDILKYHYAQYKIKKGYKTGAKKLLDEITAKPENRKLKETLQIEEIKENLLKSPESNN